MEALVEKLIEAGLTRNESRVYLELLKLGPVPANGLARKICMDRTLAYQLLNNLIGKGLVSYTIKENRKCFEAADPENLLNPVREKQIVVRDLVSELKKIEKIAEAAYEMRVYEGKEALRALINLAIKEKEFYSFGATGRAFYQLYEMPRIAEQAKKSKVKVRIIGNSKYKGTEAFSFKNFELRYLNIESEATTSIFGDRIAIHLIKEKPLIIIIKNKEIAESYKNYFEVLWREAKP